jgi:hypothetical protein
MPWLAPLETPAAPPAIDSHAPVWQSSRASRSWPSALQRGRPRDSNFSAWAAVPSTWLLGLIEHRSSTA